MNPSLKTRALALVAALAVTTAMVQLIANYALPEAPATVLAKVASRG